MVGTAVVVLDKRSYVAAAGFYIPFAPTVMQPQLWPWLLPSHITYTRRTNIRKLSVLANIRPSAAAENGLSGTVTAPFQRQRSQKV